MATITDINFKIGDVLKHLLKISGNINATELARNLNLPPVTISRIINGKVTDPRTSTIAMIANYFDVSVDQLLGHSPLPKRYRNANYINKPSTSIQLTLLSHFTANKSRNNDSVWFKWRSDYLAAHQHAFAVNIDTKKYEPQFSKNSILIFDPAISPIDGDIILVDISPSKEALIKRYVTDGNDIYFHPLNEHMRIILANTMKYKIHGIAIESHINLRNLD